MLYLVSITSQGQVSIPAKIRRALKLDRKRSAFVRQDGNKVVIEPVEDLLDLEGVFKKYAFKGKSAKEVVALEKRGVEKAVVERYKSKLKRSRGKLMAV